MAEPENNTKAKKIETARRRLLGLRPVSVVSWRDAVATIGPIVLVIGGGPEGSNFERHAESYKKILARNGIKLQIVPTRGSAENLLKLSERKVDIAFVQSGVTRETGTDDIVSLGTMFRQPVSIFYRSDAEFTRLAEMAGMRIAIGRQGSGTQFLALALLKGNGIEPGGKTELLDLEGEAAKEALLAGKADAIFLSGDSAGVKTVRSLMRAEGIRLFDFTPQGEAYERRFRYLNRLELPPGAFDLGTNLPDHRITMMAPTVELLSHRDLHPALTDLLVEAAQEIHSRSSLMQNPREFPHPIEHDYPMSEDAARYYKSGKGLAYRYLPFWLASLVNRAAVVLVPIIIVLIPGLRLAPSLYGWRIRRRLYKHYGEMMSLERATQEPMTPEQRAALLEQLDKIEKSVVGTKMPGAFADEAYVLRRHIKFVRDELTGGGARGDDVGVIMR
jgi:hypothetical protein